MPDATDARAAIQSARELHHSGGSQDAYRSLSVLFGRGPLPVEDVDLFIEALSLLADLSRAFGASQLEVKLEVCRAQPDDPKALYDAAYDLYEQGQFAVGSALLYRANWLAPGTRPIVTELAGCLEQQLRYGEAALMVDASGLAKTDPFCAYLSGFSWLMSGDLDVPRERLGVLVGVNDESIAFMRDALEGMLARADAVQGAGLALDDHALSAWQAVIDGTVLLHHSPHGHPDPMRGRYAFVADSAGLEREGLERLRAVLRARDSAPARIVNAPDRASRILATAASALMGVPRVDWTPAEAGSALVIAWSLETVENVDFLKAMHDHRPGQHLFAHASSWVDPFSYAPDVTTFLHQTVTSPWTGGAMKFDPDTKQVTRAAPDVRSDEVIAHEILAAQINDTSISTIEHVLAIARALDDTAPRHRSGLGRTSGKRLRQRAGGPVPSNRFL